MVLLNPLNWWRHMYSTAVAPSWALAIPIYWATLIYWLQLGKYHQLIFVLKWLLYKASRIGSQPTEHGSIMCEYLSLILVSKPNHGYLPLLEVFYNQEYWRYKAEMWCKIEGKLNYTGLRTLVKLCLIFVLTNLVFFWYIKGNDKSKYLYHFKFV